MTGEVVLADFFSGCGGTSLGFAQAGIVPALAVDWEPDAASTFRLNYSNGRFGHPDQDRALSAREAARLQTFPIEFQFCGSLASQARQIGNAVPVALARRFGHHLMEHAAKYASSRIPSAPRPRFGS